MVLEIGCGLALKAFLSKGTVAAPHLEQVAKQTTSSGLSNSEGRGQTKKDRVLQRIDPEAWKKKDLIVRRKRMLLKQDKDRWFTPAQMLKLLEKDRIKSEFAQTEIHNPSFMNSTHKAGEPVVSKEEQTRWYDVLESMRSDGPHQLEHYLSLFNLPTEGANNLPVFLLRDFAHRKECALGCDCCRGRRDDLLEDPVSSCSSSAGNDSTFENYNQMKDLSELLGKLARERRRQLEDNLHRCAEAISRYADNYGDVWLGERSGTLAPTSAVRSYMIDEYQKLFMAYGMKENIVDHFMDTKPGVHQCYEMARKFQVDQRNVDRYRAILGDKYKLISYQPMELINVRKLS